MLKKLILGLLAFGILVTPVRNGSTGKSEDSLSLNTQEKNTLNERLDRIGDFGGNDFGYIGGGFGHEGGGFLNDGTLLDRNTFTISVKGSETTYQSNDGECLSRTKIDRRTYSFKIIVYNTVGVHKFIGFSTLRTVYSYLYKNKAYISEESKEDAWRQAVQTDYENGVITKQEFENSYAEFLLLAYPNNNQMGEDTIPEDVLRPFLMNQQNNVNSPACIYSYVQWQDKNNNWAPLSLCKAALYVNGNQVDIAPISERGFVSFDIYHTSKYWGKMCNVQIRVYAGADTFTIGSSYLVNFDFNYVYMFVSDVKSVLIDESLDCYLAISAKNDIDNANTAKVMSICQGLALCEQFAKNNIVGFANNPNLNMYHLSIELGYSCRFNFGNNSSTLGAAGDIDWSIVFKLYGLYAQGIMGLLGSNTVIEYDAEYTNYVYHDNWEFDKGMALQSVWHQSLANMFAILAYYDNEERIGALHPTQAICDLINYADNYVPNNNSGDGSVRCTTAYLFNLYWGGYSANYGITAEGFSNQRYADFFQYVFGTCATTLSEFVRYYVPNVNPCINPNNTLLEQLNIAPNHLMQVNDFEAGIRPIFEWNLGGCASNPNNKFDLCFYDNYDNEPVFTIDNVSYTMNGGVARYELPYISHLALIAILNRDYHLCHVVVRGYQTSKSYTTGPYYSMPYTVVMPEIIEEDTIFDKKVHHCLTEKVDYDDSRAIFKNYIDTTYVKFRNGGRKMFFTRGDVDTAISIYDCTNYLLATNDNSGHGTNAFVSLSLLPNMVYKVEVKSVITNGGTFEGWSRLSILQSVSSYNNDLSVNHPVEYEDFLRINYDSEFFLRPDFDPCVNYDYYEELSVEVGNTSVMIFEPTIGGGYHIEVQYTADISINIVDLCGQEPWDDFCFSGEPYYQLGYLDNYINIPEGGAIMLLLSREDKFAPLGPGHFDDYYRFELGLTYVDGEW